MYIQIYNLRNVAANKAPMRVRAKKRYVPKTHLSMFATGEQCYNNGQPTSVHSPKKLVSSGQNVVLGRLEPRPRLKSQDQFGQQKQCIYNNKPEGECKPIGYTYEYNQQIVKTLPKQALRTDARNVFITNINHVNELFTACLRAYGYTTDAILAKIAANKANKQLTTLPINTYITLPYNGNTYYIHIRNLKVKDAWCNGRGIQFNFAKKEIQAYKNLIAQIA